MELKPLAQLLEDMLYEASDEGLEVCLAESPAQAGSRSDEQPASAAFSEVDALSVEYTLRYARAVQSITEHRGSRSYSGQRGEAGFPEWMKLDSASCWSDAAGVIYVGLVKSLGGYRLVGGGRPHPAHREAITMMPSAE